MIRYGINCKVFALINYLEKKYGKVSPFAYFNPDFQTSQRIPFLDTEKLNLSFVLNEPGFSLLFLRNALKVDLVNGNYSNRKRGL